MGNTYGVPVVIDHEEVPLKVLASMQHIGCIIDESGNLKGCGYGKVTEDSQEIYLINTLEREVAETIREALMVDPSLNVLPIRLPDKDMVYVRNRERSDYTQITRVFRLRQGHMADDMEELSSILKEIGPQETLEVSYNQNSVSCPYDWEVFVKKKE
ncbi:MAG: hypothetical protein V3V78_03840 [Candidatus Woesearchaeota archaeon]